MHRQRRGVRGDQVGGRWLAHSALLQALSRRLRLVVASAVIAVASVLQLALLLLLLPHRRLRIVTSNLYVRVLARVCIWLAGIRLEITGMEHLDLRRPALYVCNHVSLLDILIAMRILPLGTTAVAKKEIAWVPFVGWVYLLSGSLRVDRSSRAEAVAALRRQGTWVRRLRVSIIIWPEGTRSRTGRLLPFKKGFAHLALQTGLPIVPIVVAGAHKVWSAEGFDFRPGTAVRVEVVAPVDTTGWKLDSLERHIAEIRGLYLDRLPADQRPTST